MFISLKHSRCLSWDHNKETVRNWDVVTWTILWEINSLGSLAQQVILKIDQFFYDFLQDENKSR